MAKKLNNDKAFFAFVPIARSYILGEICGPINFFGTEVEQTGMLLLVSELLLFIPFFNVLTSIFYLIVFYLVFYEIVKRYIKGQEAILTIISLIFNTVGIPYIVFIIIANKYMDESQDLKEEDKSESNIEKIEVEEVVTDLEELTTKEE